MPAPQTAAQFELAQLIVSAVNLEDVDPASIDPDAPLFGAGLTRPVDGMAAIPAGSDAIVQQDC